MPTGYTPTGAGSEIYGYRPGQISTPDPHRDLAGVYPNLGAQTGQVSSRIGELLGGVVPGDVWDQIQNKSAEFGVTSGMPGSGLQRSRSARDLGLTSLDLIKTGLGAFNQTLPTVSKTQTVDPALQYEIALQNAMNAASPNPQDAGSHAESLYNSRANAASMGGGGGGYNSFAPSSGGYRKPMADTSQRWNPVNPPAAYGPQGWSTASAPWTLPAGDSRSWSAGWDNTIPDPAPRYDSVGWDSPDPGNAAGWTQQDEYNDWYSGGVADGAWNPNDLIPAGAPDNASPWDYGFQGYAGDSYDTGAADAGWEYDWMDDSPVDYSTGNNYSGGYASDSAEGWEYDW